MKNLIITILMMSSLMMSGLMAQTEIEHNSSSASPTLTLVETQDNDFSRIFFRNPVRPGDWMAMSARVGTSGGSPRSNIGWYYNGDQRLVYTEETNLFEMSGDLDISNDLEVDEINAEGMVTAHDLDVSEEANFGKGLQASSRVKIRASGQGPAGPELQFMSDNSTTTAAGVIKMTNSTGGGNNRNLIIDNRSVVGDISFILDGGTTHMRMSNGNIFSYVPLSPWITNTTDLGSSAKRWRTIYSNNALNTSDRRLKDNIVPVGNLLDKVLQLEVTSYNYKTDDVGTEKTIGFIAQDVEKIDSEWVVKPKSEEDHYLMNYSNFSAIAIKAIQEQQEIIDAQKEEIKLLREGLTSLAAKVDQLTASTGTAVADEE